MGRKIEKARVVFFCGAIISCVMMLDVGTLIAITKFVNGKPIFDQIDITQFEQDIQLQNIEQQAGPGDQISYEVKIVSHLIEDVKYSIVFKDRQVKEYDKYFYVSVTDDNGTALMNNTLDQIFTQNISINNAILKPFGEQRVKFTYTISNNLRGDFDFNFNVYIHAEGKVLG